MDADHAVLVWARCESCGGYLQLWSHGAARPDAVCMECDAWVRATVCERPRCECGDAADVEVGGMARCSWCAEHPEAGRVAAE